jgi:hypothetical protein
VQVHVKGSLACQSPGCGSWPYSLHGAGAAAPWEETTLARSLLEVRLPRLRTRSTLCRMRGFSCAAMTITRSRTSMGLPQRKPRRGRVWPRATRLDQQSAGQVEERASNCATSSIHAKGTKHSFCATAVTARHGDYADGELAHKPAPPDLVVATLAGMLGEQR